MAYSYYEKINIIREHEKKPKTLKYICNEYGISNTYLCYLLKQYREAESKHIQSTQCYSNEFKPKVVKRHFEDVMTKADLNKDTGIQYRMIKEWPQGGIAV